MMNTNRIYVVSKLKLINLLEWIKSLEFCFWYSIEWKCIWAQQYGIFYSLLQIIKLLIDDYKLIFNKWLIMKYMYKKIKEPH